MRRTLNFSRVVMTVCLCIAGKLLSAGNLSDRNNKFTEKKLNLIQEWDKTFPENDKTRVRDKDCVKNRVKRAKIVRFTLC